MQLDVIHCVGVTCIHVVHDTCFLTTSTPCADTAAGAVTVPINPHKRVGYASAVRLRA